MNILWKKYNCVSVRYLKVGMRTAYLLNPVNSSPIMAAINHLLPKDLRELNVSDDPVLVEKIMKWKLNLALKSSPKTPTLKEKLFGLQKGLCSLCCKPIDPDYLMSNGAHIHHVNPISKGGSRFALKNLTLTHI